ncbi:T9SS type A sorting domain-containing protein [Parabacteroides merdae]|uniref:T9SS C-terminal target domain-containing protein n=2 Tax=Parabacteroides TaxID=375288 RepID=A0A414BVX5_9BACT|nr:T9SS type A sorting domain-containing protein [Parabacteroides merdae]RHC83084.1 T9SS C-terminal target domain-containing protein [Parabacteroides merdae]
MPPVLNGSFDSSVKKEGTLYVPKGSYNNYWLADKWGDFINIIETDIPTSNEIVSHSNEYEIQTISNGILVCTNKPINVSIYNIHGQILVNKTISGGKVINLPKGIYIVSADNKTHKIIIK